MEEMTVNGLRRSTSSFLTFSGVVGLLKGRSVSLKVVISKFGLRETQRVEVWRCDTLIVIKDGELDGTFWNGRHACQVAVLYC